MDPHENGKLSEELIIEAVAEGQVVWGAEHRQRREGGPAGRPKAYPQGRTAQRRMCLARQRRREERGRRRPRRVGVGKESKGRALGKCSEPMGNAPRSQMG